MKTWLTKLKISSAMDARKSVPRAAADAIEGSNELRRFSENAATLEHALTLSKPMPTAPASLHAGIMRAVRSGQTVESSLWRALLPRLIPASALGLLVLLVAIGPRWAGHPAPTGASSLVVASSTLETGGELMRSLPANALSPLSDEMLRLHHDFTNAQDYLMASLP